MHKYVRITIFLTTHFMKRGVVFLFSWYLVGTTNEVEHPWCISYHGEFLGVLISNFVIFDLHDTLQRVTSVARLVRFNYYSRYIGF